MATIIGCLIRFTLRRFGRKELRKVQLDHEIPAIEDRVRYADPNPASPRLYLTVTPATEIDGNGRSANDWERTVCPS